ncbi:MAG: D-cysteine desulfhydrase family protein [Senegalia sp. (in: firmicutes)]|uniref:D-cysteine desulfhydrase family protein n=1 Tax=Senegalia sp. (in: firmicutes) TaxID=1924098 RepID=UPI003F983153
MKHNRVLIANLPTPIQKLNNLSEKYAKGIYLKRDDFTGVELSGNKVRKLEFALGEALKNGCDTIITAGAIQSNHCRATAAVCAKLGLDCELVIKGNEPDDFEGNIFISSILGANINYIPKDGPVDEKMEEVKEELSKKGKKGYIIPIGASNAVGSLGYVQDMKEIIKQEKELGLEFDAIILTVGSGGTYAGLWYANQSIEKPKDIIGFSVSDSSEEFTSDIKNILLDMYKRDGVSQEEIDESSIIINDDYIGDGYALSRPEEIEFICDIAKSEGVIFDPVYTGKAFRGMVSDIENGKFNEYKNILFIHTGGLLGWTKNQRKMAMNKSNLKLRNY